MKDEDGVVDEVQYGPEGQVVIDHLDLSDSPTVRRHAATFRQVRARLSDEAAGREAEGGGSRSRSGSAEVAGRDGLQVLGARSAAAVAEVAASHGWRVVGRYAWVRRESDGASMDSVVVAAHRSDGWALGHWRTDPIRPPMKRRWKFVGAVASDATRGTRTVGARELTAVVELDHGEGPSDDIR